MERIKFRKPVVKKERIISALCYVFLLGLIPLIIIGRNKKNTFSRKHANQSVILFVFELAFIFLFTNIILISYRMNADSSLIKIFYIVIASILGIFALIRIVALCLALCGKEFQFVFFKKHTFINGRVVDINMKNIELYSLEGKLGNFVSDDEEETAYVTINLDNGLLYDDYSGNNYINSAIIDYLDNAYKFIEDGYKIKINFAFPADMKEETKLFVKSLLKQHYSIAYKEQKKEIKRMISKGLNFILIGIALFLINGIVSSLLNDFTVLIAVFDTFSTVFIWEACYCFFISPQDNRIEMLKNARLFDAID